MESSFSRETHSREALLWEQYRSGYYWDRHEVAEHCRPIDLRAALVAGKLDAKPMDLPWRTMRDALIGLPDPELSPRVMTAFTDHGLQAGARL